MDICEKISYIKGLTEGLELNTESKEGKILAAIIDLLGDMTEEICEIEDGLDELTEQLDAVDEDLSTVEEIVYDDEGDDCGCGCSNCHCGSEGCQCGNDGCCCCGSDDDDELYEIECPACHDTIYLDADMLEDEGIDCPNCGTPLEFDFDCDCDCCEDEEECSCGCQKDE